MVRLAGVSGLLVIISILSCMAVPPPPPPPSPFGGGGGNTKPNGLRGSQIYLQDPWMHEHNYYPKSHNLGPHNHHGWGASGGSGGGGHGSNSVQLPESATYIQKLYPVFGFSNNMKRLSSAIQSLKPGKHWKWSAPAVALFGSDGTPHHVQLGGNDQSSHAGQNENDGWSYNHGSHHIGHTLPTKTQYSTW